MPGGVGGAAPKGVPLSRSSAMIALNAPLVLAVAVDSRVGAPAAVDRYRRAGRFRALMHAVEAGAGVAFATAAE